jgi:phosphohistidine swiveling domain-containing protein
MSKKYYLAKTEVCDVAPRPSPETFKLLKKLYAADGPVDRVYRQFGIKYRDTEFLTIVQSELFVDREKELQSLFPSHSYLFGTDYRARPVRFRGFLTALRNTHRFNQIAGDFEEISHRLRDLLVQNLPLTDAATAERAFLKDYETIFLINLLAQKALTRLSAALPPKMSLVEALKYFPANLPAIWTAPTDVVGNTFELTDNSTFVPLITTHAASSIPDDLPHAELFEAQNYLRLREYGRWLALRHISRFRKIIALGPAVAKTLSNLPSTLTDQPLPKSSRRPVGVSAGIASGKLVREPEAGGILVVSSLTPDLARHIPLLAGAIADHGGLLSHFAIIAREHGLPVVVNYPIAELAIGQMATIDGSTGNVKTS